jgi:hypothetical protein
VEILSRTGQGRADLLKNAVEREQQITDLKQELKQVCEAATAEKKRLEDELAEEKPKATEATTQFNTLSIGRSNLCVDDFIEGASFDGMLTVSSHMLPQPRRGA